jgi:hypothetical protein
MENQTRESLSPTARQAYWRDQLLQWAQTGISQRQFCRQRELSPHAFTWWKAKFRDELNLPYRVVRKRSSKNSSSQFLELKVFNTKLEPKYEVVLVNNRTIRVGDRFDPESLKQLMKVVESIC